MSDIVGAKAISLVTRGGVRELTHARTFEVDGSGNTYVVVITARFTSCTCAAGQAKRRCYHVAACKLAMAQQREEAQR